MAPRAKLRQRNGLWNGTGSGLALAAEWRRRHNGTASQHYDLCSLKRANTVTRLVRWQGIYVIVVYPLRNEW